MLRERTASDREPCKLCRQFSFAISHYHDYQMIDRQSSEGSIPPNSSYLEPCVFYDMHSTPSVYIIMHTSVVNPFEVPITDKSFSNDLALSTHMHF